MFLSSFTILCTYFFVSLVLLYYIGPFTKSTNKSGQGLSDVNVPVGKIWYCYSHAKMYDIPQFMYGMC